MSRRQASEQLGRAQSCSARHEGHELGACGAARGAHAELELCWGLTAGGQQRHASRHMTELQQRQYLRSRRMQEQQVAEASFFQKHAASDSSRQGWDRQAGTGYKAECAADLPLQVSVRAEE